MGFYFGVDKPSFKKIDDFIESKPYMSDHSIDLCVDWKTKWPPSLKIFKHKDPLGKIALSEIVEFIEPKCTSIIYG